MSPGLDRGARTSLALALLFSLVVHVLHAVALPFVVTYDGQVYHHLANLFGRAEFWSEFDTIRTPLYPLLLRVVFGLLGERPESVLLLHALFSFASVCCLSAVVRTLAGTRAAVVAIVALSVWPLTIAYQHSLVSESGTTCILALLVLFMLRFLERPAIGPCVAATLVLAVGYYYRPTFLYVAPCCSLLALALPFARRAGQRVRLRFALGTAALLTLVPLCASLPWRALQDRAGRFGYVYAFGIVNQALIDPADERELGRVAGPYRDCVRAASPDGRLDPGGLLDMDATRILNSLPPETIAAGSSWFRRLVRENPLRYARGVTGSLLVYLGWPALETDNGFFVAAVLSDGEEGFLYLHPRYLEDPLWKRFSKPPAPAAVRALGVALAGPWCSHAAVLLSNCAALGLLVLALVRRDLSTLLLPALVFHFYLLHSVTLLSIDRYAYPAYYLLQAILVVIGARTVARLRRARATTISAASGAPGAGTGAYSPSDS